MKKKLMNNLGMKLISLALAIVFWLVVVSLEDPEATRSYEIPVTRINEDLIRENNMTYEVVSGNTVTVTIRARQSILRELTVKDFEATADLSKLSFAGAVPIEVQVKRYASQVTIVSGTNNVMQVSIEELGSADIMITARTTGTVAGGKALGELSVQPNMIHIEGAKTTVDKITNVYAEVNVSGLSQDTSFTVEPVLYNQDGDVIGTTDLTLSVTNVTVNVSLLDTKTVPVSWDIEATAASGYGIRSQDYTPKEVTISGTTETLADITEIKLDDYVVNDLTESTEYTVDIEEIVRSMGCRLVDPDTEGSIRAAVNVEPYEEVEEEIPLGDIRLENIDPTYSYTKDGDDTISFTLRGLQSDINNLNMDNVTVYVDMEDLGAGTHEVALQLQNAQNVEMTEEVTIQVTIRKK